MTKTPLGKGMMAGGMAGAGILGMVIKKAIEEVYDVPVEVKV